MTALHFTSHRDRGVYPPVSPPVPVLARDLAIGDRIAGRTVSGIMIYDTQVRPTEAPKGYVRSRTLAEVTFTDGSCQTWDWDTELLDVERTL